MGKTNTSPVGGGANRGEREGGREGEEGTAQTAIKVKESRQKSINNGRRSFFLLPLIHFSGRGGGGED